jgi:hypothetical protein
LGGEEVLEEVGRPLWAPAIGQPMAMASDRACPNLSIRFARVRTTTD